MGGTAWAGLLGICALHACTDPLLGLRTRIHCAPHPPLPPPPRANCKKNKVAPPYKLAEFDILFGSGISANGCLLDAAEAVDVVQKRGSWYYAGEARLAQGRDKTLEALKADDELRE